MGTPTNQTGTYTRLIPALDGWSEMVLVASVAREKLLSNPEKMPVVGVTTYGQCGSLFGGEFSAKYKDYVFLQPSNLDARVDYLTLNFGAPKTAAQKRIPFRTRTYTDDWSWPMVLRKLEVVQNSFFPQATNAIVSGNGDASLVTANRLHLRMDGVPGIEKGTRFIEREYLSPTKFTIPPARVPVPGMIAIDFVGLQQTIPESLHGRLKLDDQSASLATLLAGETANGQGTLKGATYPETNFTEWEAYIYPDKQQQLPSGVWYRLNYLLIPPEMPDPIRLN